MKELLLAAGLCLASAAHAQDAWAFEETVVYKANHDPGMVHLEGGAKLQILFDGIAFEELDRWKPGKRVKVVFSKSKGALLYDPDAKKGATIVGGLAQHPIDKLMDACLAKAVSTLDIAGCYGDARERWDALLNVNYQQLMKALDETKKADVKAAQLAWIKFRDAQVKAFGQVIDQGSISQIQNAQLGMQVTKEQAQRIVDIRGQM